MSNTKKKQIESILRKQLNKKDTKSLSGALRYEDLGTGLITYLGPVVGADLGLRNQSVELYNEMIGEKRDIEFDSERLMSEDSFFL